MSKIKVCIVNHGDNQLPLLKKVIAEFQSYKKHEVSLTLFSNVFIDFHDFIPISNTYKHDAPFIARGALAEAYVSNQYDLFIYNENDMVITEANIDALIKVNERLDCTKYVGGFIRYETNADGKNLLTDLNPHWPLNITSETINNERWWTPGNLHQGCFVLNKQQMWTALLSRNFIIPSHTHSFYGQLECGASDPYTICDLKKVFPSSLTTCQDLCIHHTSNKYVSKPEWQSAGITINQLFNYIP